MNLIWLKINETLEHGISLINQTEKNKFYKLIGHIADNIGERNESGLFNPEDLLALQKVLKLDENEVAIMIKTIRYILKRLSRFVMSPSSVSEDLTTSLNMEQEKAIMFVEKYKSLIKNLTQEFGIYNFGNIDELKQANWQVNLEMTSSINQLERHPSVLLELRTCQKSPLNELLLEFDEYELKTFNQQLENIQSEVDNIIT